MNTVKFRAHISLFLAACMWGLMAPIGKAAMDAGITGLMLANMRMLGAAVCFWLASLFAKKEQVGRKDLFLMFMASMLSIVLNQGCYTFGLSLTSPVDASIVTTMLPIITMILAALFLKEPVTPLKVGGILMGLVGAVILVMSNATSGGRDGNIWGDMLCLCSQFSFACYLTIFKGLIARYNIFTLMKWMFLFASVCFIPFSYTDFVSSDFSRFGLEVWLEVGFVVFFGTFLAYIFMLYGQKTVRPTIVSMYNYFQPIMGTSVAVLMGMSTFGWNKAMASLLIFAGVYVVTQSKSRVQVATAKHAED